MSITLKLRVDKRFRSINMAMQFIYRNTVWFRLYIAVFRFILFLKNQPPSAAQTRHKAKTTRLGLLALKGLKGFHFDEIIFENDGASYVELGRDQKKESTHWWLHTLTVPLTFSGFCIRKVAVNCCNDQCRSTINQQKTQERSKRNQWAS